ncbi:DUF4259 domain-containing protein [Streptomyces sp. enrichment culture]|uniref:DUF4259 domain-containing protein n=1 Tax=Streptomyces sp. enrichment culture TaxID=1795815 RepID=UPI003F55AAA6
MDDRGVRPVARGPRRGAPRRWHGAGAGVLLRDLRLRFDGADLQPLAVEALDRVVAEASELWDETPEGPRWRQNIRSLRAVLAPEPEPQEDLLLDF